MGTFKKTNPNQKQKPNTTASNNLSTCISMGFFGGIFDLPLFTGGHM